MANPNFKGRPKGDPLLGKFKIAIDEYSFNVVDTEKNKTLGFHTALPDAILSIAKYQMLQEKTFKLTEYAEEFKQTHINLKNAILK